MSLKTHHVTLSAARSFVAEHHRHLPKCQGGIIAIGCYDGDRLCGVAILGRPSARLLDDGSRMEIVRVATDGTLNACSKLYGQCRRVAQALGFVGLITYTLPSEGGTSLRAAGWIQDGVTDGGEWDRLSRSRAAAACPEPKIRWSASG